MRTNCLKCGEAITDHLVNLGRDTVPASVYQEAGYCGDCVLELSMKCPYCNENLEVCSCGYKNVTSSEQLVDLPVVEGSQADIERKRRV